MVAATNYLISATIFPWLNKPNNDDPNTDLLKKTSKPPKPGGDDQPSTSSPEQEILKSNAELLKASNTVKLKPNPRFGETVKIKRPIHPKPKNPQPTNPFSSFFRQFGFRKF